MYHRLTQDQSRQIRAGYVRLIRQSRARRAGFLRAQREAVAFINSVR